MSQHLIATKAALMTASAATADVELTYSSWLT